MVSFAGRGARVPLTLGSLLVLFTGSACKPDLEGRPSLVDAPRVLAIRSQAPEVEPGTRVVYDVLVARPLGSGVDLGYDWALCTIPKPLAESGPIAQACLQPSSPAAQPIGNTESVEALIPSSGCAVFGPLPPDQKPGQPAVRPQDPDTTGGYYQPVRLLTTTSGGAAEYQVGVTRLSCGIAAGASQEVAIAFAKEYHPNTTPGIDAVDWATGTGEPITIDVTPGAAPQTVAAGSVVQLRVRWAGCPDSPSEVPCTGSEAYASYDPVQGVLQYRREAIRVSWYATHGDFAYDRTGRAEVEATISGTSNTWTAPGTPTTVRFWLVIRDDRQGIGWASFDLAVVA